MRRQTTRSGLPEIRLGKGGAWERNDESNQMLGTIRQGTGDNGYVSERQVPPKHGFHVLGLNSVAVHLELIIDAAKKMQKTCFVAAYDIAGAVKQDLARKGPR